MGADSKRPLATLLVALAVACGGGGSGGSDDDGSEAASSSASNTATVGTTSTATSTSGGGATSSSSKSTSTTGEAAPWLCLEVSSGCLCSTIPGSEGETEPCATAYDCCYGLEGSTCYCLETPEAMCAEIIEVGYTRYNSCPP